MRSLTEDELNKDIRSDKDSILYIPDPEPVLKYDTTGHVKDDVHIPEIAEDIPDKVKELKDSGEAVVSASAYMPKYINEIIENTVNTVLKNVDPPKYDPYKDEPVDNKETPSNIPDYKFDNEIDNNIDIKNDSDDIEVPDFFPPAPSYDLVVTVCKPLYQVASDVYTSDMYEIKQYFVRKLQEAMSKYFSQLVRIKNECGVSDITKLLDDFDAAEVSVSDSNLVHLSDYVTRSQIIRDQKTRLFNKTHNTNETLYHLRACLAAKEQRARYYKANYGDSSTFLSTKSNSLLLNSRQQYDANYKNAVYNLFKYLNSSVLIINDSLQMSLNEAAAKGQLLKNNVNIFLADATKPAETAAIVDNTPEIATKPTTSPAPNPEAQADTPAADNTPATEPATEPSTTTNSDVDKIKELNSTFYSYAMSVKDDVIHRYDICKQMQAYLTTDGRECGTLTPSVDFSDVKTYTQYCNGNMTAATSNAVSSLRIATEHLNIYKQETCLAELMKDIDGNYISIPYTLTLATQNDQAERLIIKNALDRWTVAQTIGTQIFSNFG